MKIGLLFLLSVLAMCNPAYANTLQIRVEQPDTYKRMSGIDTVYIFLSGVIDANSPKRLANVLKDERNHFADVYINSPGGNLLAGMELGRQLRQSGATVNIGIGGVKPRKDLKEMPFIDVKPGICFSACSLTFLGGVYRFISEGSKFGVHRFYSNSGPSPDDLALGQMLSATISSYIRDMGVSGDLFNYMVTAGPEEMFVIPKNELKKLNVVNNGRQLATWSIEAVEGGQYLRGEQITLYGRGKMVFLCTEKSVGMLSFYEAGQERANQIASGNWAHSLLLKNSTVLPLSKPIHIDIVGDEIEQSFKLTKREVDLITTSDSVGHAMQVSRDAPSFVGFTIDVIDKTHKDRVKNFLNNCF